MSPDVIVFYSFAAILVASALGVVLARNPVHSALLLVLVYVGAVMVLFLFVVMMLDINIARLRVGFWRYLPLGALVASLLVAEMALILARGYFGAEGSPAPEPLPAGYSNTKELGRLIYTEYVYPFEIAAVVLLVGIVAAIALTLRRRKNSKYIDPAQQVNVRREDRVRIVSMPVERAESDKP